MLSKKRLSRTWAAQLVLGSLLCTAQSVGAATPAPKPVETRHQPTVHVDVHLQERSSLAAGVRMHPRLHHIRLNHNINRYANRSQQMLPPPRPSSLAHTSLLGEHKSSDNLQHFLFVHDDASARSISTHEPDKTDSQHGAEKPSQPSTQGTEREQRSGEHTATRVEGNRERAGLHHHRLTIRLHHHARTQKNEGYAGANGDSGGGGESVSALGGPATTQLGAIKEITLGQGSALIAHNQHVVVHTDQGKVHVMPGAAAYVAQIGKTVSVYNLGDAHDGEVNFEIDGKNLTVPLGQQLVLTREPQKDFASVNPIKEITSRNSNLDGTMHDTAIFHADYSPVSALDHIPQFARLVNSDRKGDRQLADHLIKNAAVLVQLSPGFEEDKEQPSTSDKIQP